jgi:hypothetical protein
MLSVFRVIEFTGEMVLKYLVRVAAVKNWVIIPEDSSVFWHNSSRF